MIIEGGAAAVLVITTHSPFGEPERTASRWLPYLRLGTVLAMTGVAIGMAVRVRGVRGRRGGVHDPRRPHPPGRRQLRKAAVLGLGRRTREFL